MNNSSDLSITARCCTAAGPVADMSGCRHRLADGTEVVVRPLTPADAALERDLLERLSPESRAFRFLGPLKVTDKIVASLTAIDPARDTALIALVGEKDGTSREIGVCRLGTEGVTRRGECAVVVSDDWHRKGVATLLMNHLIDNARKRGLLQLYSIDVADNPGMRGLAERLGFARANYPEYPGEVVHTLQL